VGLQDRASLRTLRAALDPRSPDNELISHFYTLWFAMNPAVRDLFPPDMGTQRAAFGHALWWVLGELVAQRSEEPIAFLAQLGRDHRKYGVTEGHYQTLQDALYTSFRSQLDEVWDAALDETARHALTLIVGVMSGAADAEAGPGW
jgi:hemoglobin-like flavoprotein